MVGSIGRIIDRFLEWKPPAIIDSCLKYRSVSTVQVDYPFIGLVNRVFQIAILAYTLTGVFREKLWAYNETPLNVVNAYGGAGDNSFFLNAMSASGRKATYCNNESHAFKYSDWYNYTTPDCHFVIPEQLIAKGRDRVQFVTVFLENDYQGWPCAAAGSAAKQDDCTSNGGELTAIPDGQCLCRTPKTIYPVGVDGLVMSFDHTYEFPDGKGSLRNWKGSSSLDHKGVEANPQITSILRSTITYTDGTEHVLPEGGSVSLTVRKWLEAAGSSLDELNTIALGDTLGRPGGGVGGVRLPHFRMTGMVITVNIKYHNGEPSITENSQIHANISASRQLLAWAGPGSERVHITYPTGEPGAQTFHYVDRYQQGVVFDFQATGRVYLFDYMYLVQTLVSAVVLLSVAGTITDTIAFYCLPNGHSSVLNAHRRVNVSKRQGFAELGIRTAIAARDFSAFDPDHNTLVEAEDIVKVLARVAGPGVTYKKKIDGKTVTVPFDCEKAHAIAIAILMDQHEAERASATSFDFMDYMRTQDNGTIDFPTFLQNVAIPNEGSWVPTDDDKKRVQAGWDEGLRHVGTKANEKQSRRKSSARPGSTMRSGSDLAAVTVQVSQVPSP